MRYISARALSGNGFKSKFERMNPHQIWISNSYQHRCVADLPVAVGPEHRITLRDGMCPSCSTSHWKHWNEKNNSEKLYRGCGSSKNDFRQHSADHQFFRRRCANFVRIFGRVKTYKPKNPSGWHYLLDEPSPEMDSNPNLNGWTSI